MASNLGHSTPIDVQDVISLEEIPGSAAPNESNRCSYVDFKDNKPLKRGHCHEERPFICKQTAGCYFVLSKKIRLNVLLMRALVLIK